MAADDPGPGPGPSAPPPPSQGYAAEAKAGTVGICVSGGGVRAASYGLGALQALQEHGLLTGPSRADYVSAVSGGSYITTALALVARGAMPGDDPERVVAAEDPFARGTPEEQYVRNHTTYLTHGPGGTISYIGRLFGGIFLNLLFLVLLLHLLFRPAGWVYGWAIPSLRRGGRGADVHFAIPVVIWSIPVVLLTLGAAVGLVQIAVRWRKDGVRHQMARWAALLLAAGAVLAVVLVGVPKLLEAVRDVLARVGGVGGASTTASESYVRSNERLVTLGGVAAAGGVATGVWAAFGRVVNEERLRTAERWLTRKLLALAGRFSGFLRSALATLFGPALLLVVAVAFLNLGAANTVAGRQSGRAAELLTWLGAALVLLVLWYFADLVSWSLHPTYKRRLSSTYALRRVQPSGSTLPEAEARPYSALYRLSDAQPPHLPEVLICAAANISDYGRTPTGSNVTSFVFSAREIGGPVVDTMPTKDYEQVVCQRGRDFTLPAAMSVSGAAFSPSMGKMTRAPVRFLIALLNLRLGVWLPSPLRIKESRRVAPEEASLAQKRDRQLADTTKRSVFPISPRVDYLLRELFGRNHARARFVYVTDGGHYENLGLVELLRRGCTTVWCIDASGETITSFGTVAQAVSIARSELAVDIAIQPGSMGPPPDAKGAARRFVRRTHLTGTIRYHDGTEGTLVLIKAGVPADAPADVLYAHGKWRQFPCDPTLNQLYTAERFDAYRALGHFSTARALRDLGPRPAPPAGAGRQAPT